MAMAKMVELIPAPSFNENSYSKRILSQLSETREKNRRSQSWNIPEVITLNKSNFWVTLDWIQDSLPRYLKDPNVKTPQPDKSGSLQEIDLLREFYLGIAENGLPATFERWGPNKPKPPPSGTVLIVGAGMSGMAAAYELERAGYKDVKILEMSQRFGGRVKTLDMKDGFDRGLHTDGKNVHCSLRICAYCCTFVVSLLFLIFLQLVLCVSHFPQTKIVQSMSQSITSLTTILKKGSDWSKLPLATRVTMHTTASTETSYKSQVTRNTVFCVCGQ